jgi:hypothetical protein
MRKRRLVFGFVLGVGFVSAAVGAGAGVTAQDAAPADADGFVSLFNGRDLEGWDGDPRLWSVRDGVLRGETTPGTPARGNTFLIRKGDALADFVLKLEFRVGDENNSGVQFRSERVAPGPGVPNPWVVRGYQAEVEEKPGKVGFLYDEGRRGWLVDVGDFLVLERVDGKLQKNVVGKVSDRDRLIANGYYKPNETGQWNAYTITCRGNHVAMELNGFPTVELIDNDPAEHTRAGVIALQLHAGAPMWVEYRNIRVKRLAARHGDARRLFNGRDLSGWTVPFANARETFSVEDGTLAISGKPNAYIRTEERFKSFVLRLQLRHLAPCNSGVLLRMSGEDRVWPRSIEAQGHKDNLGDIYNIGEVAMTTDPDRTTGRRTRKMHPSNERPVGEWNRYEIRLDRGDLEIRVNGLCQNTATGCEEIAGWIGLQSEGGPVAYRNVVLIPIEDDPAGRAPEK